MITYRKKKLGIPEWDDVYKWAVDAHGPDIDQGRYAVLRGCYEFIKRSFMPIDQVAS